MKAILAFLLAALLASVSAGFPVLETTLNHTWVSVFDQHWAARCTSDATGDNVYFTDYHGDHVGPDYMRVGHWNRATGEVHQTINASYYGNGTVGGFSPRHTTEIVNGIFYFSSDDFQLMRYHVATGVAEHVAGSGLPRLEGDEDGTGIDARFRRIAAIQINDAGTRVYVGQTNHALREVDVTNPGVSAGVVTTLPVTVAFTIVSAGMAYIPWNGAEMLVGHNAGFHGRFFTVNLTSMQAGVFGQQSTPHEGYTVDLAAPARSVARRDGGSIWVVSSVMGILSWNEAMTSFYYDTTGGYIDRTHGICGIAADTGKVYTVNQETGGDPAPANWKNGLVEWSVSNNSVSSTQAPTCVCAGALTADYANTLVPDAAQTATADITLDTDTWKVRFSVSGVRSVTNGHVIAAPVDARQNANVALSGLTAPFATGDLWSGSQCALGPIDTPAASLGINATADPVNCQRTYTIEYSLINPADRTSHCQLANTVDNEVRVECELELNTIRAYDGTMPNALLAKETVFRANITMPRNLPNEVGTLLHASLAKCSVFAAPAYYLDCRIPSLWNFDNTFSVTQSPSWIVDSSCQQTNGTDATFIRCDLQSISQIYTEVTATIGATVLPSGQVMSFNVNYSLPREETATATGSLASFVKSIGTKDGKFYYGNDDLLTLEIEVVETARLQITQLELFNSDSPVQTYNLRTTPEFETVETQNATFFVITFYPARKLDDSNFYRHGPHGVNVSFLFTAARRQEGAPQAGDQGVVTYSGVGLKAPKGDTAAQTSSSPASGLSQTAVAAIAGAALVAVVAVVAATVMIVRSKKTTATSEKAAPHNAAQSEIDLDVVPQKHAIVPEIDTAEV